jgi:hypothetical protein
VAGIFPEAYALFHAALAPAHLLQSPLVFDQPSVPTGFGSPFDLTHVAEMPSQIWFSRLANDALKACASKSLLE